ncbi:hypothetical protein DFH09DRAFT_1375882 [Mycena vulgaris]|nr:hypothetical protein DFH09DRAFT_1375882 [Mycena vulgaris]
MPPVVKGLTHLASSFTPYIIYPIMPPKKKKTTSVSHVMVPDTDSEGDDDTRPAPRTYVAEQHIHRGPDGHFRHDFAMVPAPASPTKRGKPATTLKPDLPPIASFQGEGFDGWADGDQAGEEDDEGPVYDMVGKTRDPDERGPVRKEPRRVRASDNPTGMWVAKDKPQLYLDEIVQLDGRGEYQDDDGCIVCNVAAATYRCQHCFTDDLYCKSCIVEAHCDSPLHRVEVWEGGMLKRTTLKRLGLRIQLGHGKLGKGHRGKCVLPSEAVDDDFVVVDTHAIHEVAVDFCNCSTAQPHDIQLLPATFRVLRRYHLMALESKCSGSEFYNSIARETDNTGTEPVRDRYDEFLRMAREWRHLQMLKRAGRGHDPYGVVATRAGECALLCPACPQPGMNLPDNWKETPKEKWFLYALFLALDANFRMRRKKVSSEEKDPSLGDGWSFYGAITPYYTGAIRLIRHRVPMAQEHLGTHEDIRQRTHIEACNILFSFHLTRYVGMTDGEAPERGWSNLNPLATSTAEMGPGMRRDTINDAFNDWNHKKIIGFGLWGVKKITECVPEMITTSVELEELEESLRNLGAGDALEKWRAEVEAWEEDAQKPNPFASRVKQKTVLDVRREMAEEVEKEMDEDQMGGLAVSEEMHATEMIGMGLQLEELQRNLAFDVASVGNHPSSEQQTNMTERTNKLRRKLLTWMDAQVGFIPHVALLCAEEDRARTRISATQSQPGVKVQHLALWLPSDIKGRVECDDELYEYEFRLREAQGHEALEDLRHQLLLRTHLYKNKDMYAHGVKANTRAQTKIEGVDERIRRTAERYRAARRALVGLGAKLKEARWQFALLPLLAEDVRGMPRALFQDPERKNLMQKKGSTARQTAAEAGAKAKARMSWIWRSPGVDEGEAGAKGMNEALRIEWAKTRARAMCQEEQVDLLEEEMRRVLAFLRYKADWWEGRAAQRPRVPLDGRTKVGIMYAPAHKAYDEGNVAYARRQALRLRELTALFETKWEDVPGFISMGRTALGILPEEEEELAPWDPAVDVEEVPDEEPVPPRPPPPTARGFEPAMTSDSDALPRAYVDSLHRPHHGDYFWMFCHPKSWKPRAPGSMTGGVRLKGWLSDSWRADALLPRRGPHRKPVPAQPTSLAHPRRLASHVRSRTTPQALAPALYADALASHACQHVAHARPSFALVRPSTSRTYHVRPKKDEREGVVRTART